MAIWVSRYSNKELLKSKYYPVGISLGLPRFRLGYDLMDQCYALAPKGNMMKMEWDEFRRAYLRKLDDIGSNKIIGIVNKLNDRAMEKGKELVFLCYEDVREEGQDCHRTLFAEWWLKYTGEIIEELPDPSVPKSQKARKKQTEEANYKQMSLFDIVRQ